MKDKKLRIFLVGKFDNDIFDNIDKRTIDLIYSAKDKDDFERHIKFCGDDGIILYLIKRIEKLERLRRQ